MLTQSFLSDLDIAQKNTPMPIEKIGQKIGIHPEDLELFGSHKAKISLDLYKRLNNAPMGKLIVVSAMTPTPPGEGKTTTTVGLGDGLNRIGKKAIICLREPSLGPCFGLKGGAAGGGYAQVVPMEDINLHFTGDFHAIGLAHNLMAATLDNHIHQGNQLGIDPRRITISRVMDMNDRALRKIVIGLGGPGNSMPRESGFDITVASEVMAIFCLAESLQDLKQRLGKIIVGYTFQKNPITVSDLNINGAMTVLLKNSLKPNLVQTLEHNPALIHGGPFANIAHGCNSVIATKTALRLADFTVTEAGFGADLGMEKFFNIKCRKAGLKPDGVVLVATIRALKHQGGCGPDQWDKPNADAIKKGFLNLKKHVANVRLFGCPVLACLNSFSTDTQEERQLVQDLGQEIKIEMIPSDHWARGGVGAEKLARAVIKMVAGKEPPFQFLYEDTLPIWDKIKAIALQIYGANDIMADSKLRKKIADLEQSGFGRFPICMAKTPFSFSTDPKLRGAPKNFDVPLKDVRVSAGAGFLVVLTGEIMTMPGLPKVPSAEHMDISEDGKIIGLF